MKRSKAEIKARKQEYNRQYWLKRKAAMEAEAERQSTFRARADNVQAALDPERSFPAKKTSQASKVKANGNQRLSSSAMSGGTSSGGIKASIAKNGKATKNNSKEIIALQRLSGGKARIVVIVIPG